MRSRHGLDRAVLRDKIRFERRILVVQGRRGSGSGGRSWQIMDGLVAVCRRLLLDGEHHHICRVSYKSVCMCLSRHLKTVKKEPGAGHARIRYL